MVLDDKGWMAVDNFGATETNTRLETVPVAHSDNALVVLDSDSGNREIRTLSCLWDEPLQKCCSFLRIPAIFRVGEHALSLVRQISVVDQTSQTLYVGLAVVSRSRAFSPFPDIESLHFFPCRMSDV